MISSPSTWFLCPTVTRHADGSIHRLRRLAPIAFALFALLASANASFAQNVDIPAALDPNLDAPPTALTLQYLHQFKADVEDAGTEIARDNVLLSGVHRFVKADNVSVYGIGTYTLQNYEFSHKSGNNYQWNDIHRFVVGSMVGYSLNDKWNLLGGAVVRSWAEGGATFSGSLTAGGFGGFSYQANPDLSVGLLIGAFSGLEQKFTLFPVPTLRWKFAEDWLWNVGMVSVGDPGIGTEFVWNFADQFELGAGATYQVRRYRLDNKTRISPTSPYNPRGRSDKNGVGQETEVPVFAALRYRPTKRSIINLMGGVAFAGNIRVENNTGGKISDDDYDPAPFVAMIARIAF